MSIVPAAATAGSNRAGSAASATTYRAPTSSAAARNGPSRRAVRPTSYPRSHSLRAQAFPMPPLPPVINAVRTRYLSAVLPRQRLRRQREDSMVRIAGQHIGLGIGEMPRGQPPRPVGVAGLDHLRQPNVSVQHGTPLAERRILTYRGGLLGPLLFVAAPQCLQAAHHRDHRVIPAAANDLIVKLAADLGEAASVVEVRGHRLVDLLEFRHQRIGPICRPPPPPPPPRPPR